MRVDPIYDKKDVRRMFKYLDRQNTRNGVLFYFGISTMLRISDIIDLKVKNIWNSHGKFRRYLVIREKKTSHAKKIKPPQGLRQKIFDYCKKYDLSRNQYLFKFSREYDSEREKDARELQLEILNKTKAAMKHLSDIKMKHCIDKNLDTRKKIPLVKTAHKKQKKKIYLKPSLKKVLQNYRDEAGLKPSDWIFFSETNTDQHFGRVQAYRIIEKAARKLRLKENVGTHTMRKTGAYHLYHSTGKDIEIVMEALGHEDAKQTRRYIGVQQEHLDKAYRNIDL